ncbi:MAG TPA: hypothetical protein V6D08_07510 [Candidatus Obscuribacterales bacterium]
MGGDRQISANKEEICDDIGWEAATAAIFGPVGWLAYREIRSILNNDRNDDSGGSCRGLLDVIIDGLDGLSESAREGERSNLETQLERHSTPEQMQQVRQDMARFQERAARDGLSDAEVASTYREVSRLLQDHDGAAIEPELRARLARQILHNAASPYELDQGQHQTCSVSALSVRLYTLNPSEAARVVADVATSNDGHFTTVGGRTVTLDSASLRPDSEAEQEPVPDGKRDYANQILQLAMTNAYWSGRSSYSEDGTTYTGPFTYVQRHDVTAGDSGEALLDGSGRRVDGAPHIDAAGMAEVFRDFSRAGADPFVVIDTGMERSQTSGARPAGLTAVDSPEALLSVIQAQQDGNMPLVVLVHPEREPWNSTGRITVPGQRVESGSGPPRAAAAEAARPRTDTEPQPRPRPDEPQPQATEIPPHAINIVGCYRDEASGRWMVRTSNQWGEASDVTVDLETLYNSMRTGRR